MYDSLPSAGCNHWTLALIKQTATPAASRGGFLIISSNWKKVRHIKKNRGFQADLLEDWRSSDLSSGFHWIFYFVKTGSTITKMNSPHSQCVYVGENNGMVCEEKSLNAVKYELNHNARSLRGKGTKKGKSSACCGLSSIYEDTIVIHWTIHFYRASQFPKAPAIMWPVSWHWT